MKYIGDMAARAGQAEQNEQLKKIEDGQLELETTAAQVMREERRGIFSKITFEWSQADQLTLDQIRVAAEQGFAELFEGALFLVDQLYAELRVPEVNSYDQIKFDDKNRQIWKTDDYGNYIEDWNQLTGEDIEKCLFDLARVRMRVAPMVNNLMLEAMFAKRIYTDAKDEAHLSIIDGTIPDKEARSNRKSRKDNYHAFFRFWLWTQGDVFVKEMDNFQRILERTRDWRVRSQWK